MGGPGSGLCGCSGRRNDKRRVRSGRCCRPSTIMMPPNDKGMTGGNQKRQCRRKERKSHPRHARYGDTARISFTFHHGIYSCFVLHQSSFSFPLYYFASTLSSLSRLVAIVCRSPNEISASSKELERERERVDLVVPLKIASPPSGCGCTTSQTHHSSVR